MKNSSIFNEKNIKFLIKISNFDKKYQILTKNSNFNENLNFYEKYRFLMKKSIFTNFYQFLPIFVNFSIIAIMARGQKVTKKRTFLTPPEEIGGQLCAEEVCWECQKNAFSSQLGLYSIFGHF